VHVRVERVFVRIHEDIADAFHRADGDRWLGLRLGGARQPVDPEREHARTDRGAGYDRRDRCDGREDMAIPAREHGASLTMVEVGRQYYARGPRTDCDTPVENIDTPVTRRRAAAAKNR